MSASSVGRVFGSVDVPLCAHRHVWSPCVSLYRQSPFSYPTTARRSGHCPPLASFPHYPPSSIAFNHPTCMIRMHAIMCMHSCNSLTPFFRDASPPPHHFNSLPPLKRSILVFTHLLIGSGLHAQAERLLLRPPLRCRTGIKHQVLDPALGLEGLRIRAGP